MIHLFHFHVHGLPLTKSQSKDEGLLLSNFFRLWFAIRRTATTEHIVGDDTLDMAPETVDRSYPLFGKVPLPPVMIQQLDMILTLGLLQPLRKKVLEDFQKIVLANKPRSWLTIYLCTCMFLHSCAVLSAENYANARKHGLRVFSSPPASGPKLCLGLISNVTLPSDDTLCLHSSQSYIMELTYSYHTTITAHNLVIHSLSIGPSENPLRLRK